MPIVVPVCLGAAMAFKPSSIRIALGFWITNTYFMLLGFPTINTNQTVQFFVGCTVLGAALGLKLRAPRESLTVERWFERFAPALRLCVVVLYFWTIVHKLNADFFRPNVSCASHLTAGLLRRLHISVTQNDVALTGIAATVLAEAALPLGLLFKRTQGPTALFALVFHWILGITGFYGFSSTMMSLLPLFCFPVAGEVFSGYRGREWFNRLALVGYIALLLFAKYALSLSTGWVGNRLWTLLPLPVVVLYWVNRGSRSFLDLAGRATWETLVPVRLLARPRPLYLVPLLLFFNGASPYLGWKTEYSYAMYSNLRTEGGRTNHLFLPVISLFDYQTDLVEVLPGSDATLLKELPHRAPRYKLQTLVWALKSDHQREDVKLVARDGDQLVELGAAELDPRYCRRPTFLEARLLSFRSIVEAKPGVCPH